MPSVTATALSPVSALPRPRARPPGATPQRGNTADRLWVGVGAGTRAPVTQSTSGWRGGQVERAPHQESGF